MNRIYGSIVSHRDSEHSPLSDVLYDNHLESLVQEHHLGVSCRTSQCGRSSKSPIDSSTVFIGKWKFQANLPRSRSFFVSTSGSRSPPEREPQTQSICEVREPVKPGFSSWLATRPDPRGMCYELDAVARVRGCLLSEALDPSLAESRGMTWPSREVLNVPTV